MECLRNDKDYEIVKRPREQIMNPKMIKQDDLLLKASTTSDEERFTKLLEYDHQQHGVMLYRYRHVSTDRLYEIDALSKCKIWASNPNCLDDAYEFKFSCTSPKDYECLRDYLKEYEAKKNHSKGERIKINTAIDKMYCLNKKELYNYFMEQLDKKRCGYAVTCFTENAPFDNDHNMWDQYAKGSGICLGYSIKSLVSNGIILDPVYYVEEGEKSFANLYKLFGNSTRFSLSFCVKDKYGVDKYADDNRKETICWADQKEWRYAIDNVKYSDGIYAAGLYLKRSVPPDIVYIKNLAFGLFLKIFLAAKKNRIRIKML